MSSERSWGGYLLKYDVFKRTALFLLVLCLWCLAVYFGTGFVASVLRPPGIFNYVQGGEYGIGYTGGARFDAASLAEIRWRCVYNARFGYTRVDGTIFNEAPRDGSPPRSGDLSRDSIDAPAAVVAATPWSISRLPPPPGSAVDSRFSEDAYGWPCRFLVIRDRLNQPPVVPGMPRGAGMGLPRETIWLFDGIAWNLGIGVVFSLVASTGLLWFWRFARSSRRIVRGQCPNCAYEWRGLRKCPECGTVRLDYPKRAGFSQRPAEPTKPSP